MKALKIMNSIFMTITVLGVVLMFSAVIIQVFARFVLPKAPSWTEEAARFFFIAAIAFAAPLAMKNREYVRVDLILGWLPKKITLFIEVAIDIFIIIFIFIVAVYSIEFIKLGSIQTAPTLEVVMSIPFSSTLIASFFIGIYGILNLIQDIKALKRGVVS